MFKIIYIIADFAYFFFYLKCNYIYLRNKYFLASQYLYNGNTTGKK